MNIEHLQNINIYVLQVMYYIYLILPLDPQVLIILILYPT